MTFDEAMELAYFGGQVLHPSAMVPCIEERIPVLVKTLGRRVGRWLGGRDFVLEITPNQIISMGG